MSLLEEIRQMLLATLFAAIILAMVFGMAGCSPGLMPPPSELAAPSKRLMTAPQAAANLKTGDDLYEDNVRLSEAYVRETSRLRSLQEYVRTVLKK